ncbi:AAA-like domain-containing protein [Oxynema sp. CENA135]|uniref:AAA-like domain-containing protein n=1 Tax=Oxynema sp. CENA135 TaxID=984206 RepID=UPI00190B421D|nr:AAA-like domain-containing protein [Oxynema sp. CENA135]MBK4731499.1 AAA-like domain-containing protein [Oxynema sp. CENA135]
MTIDQIVQLLNASLPRPLSELQEWLLRCSWEGQTYADMAAQLNYSAQYLRSQAASELWPILSEFWGEPISKPNLRSRLELRPLNRQQQQLLEALNCTHLYELPNFPSGPVPLDSPLYIERPPIEELAYQELTRPGAVIRIKAPRLMGKSSLMLRMADRAGQLNYHTVKLDFQEADASIFNNSDRFLRWLSANVTRQLQLDLHLDDYWFEEIGSKVSCTSYFEGYLLSQIDSPLLFVLNEVNIVFEYPEIARDFLPLLRFWHEQAKQREMWKKLRLVVVYSTEVYIPLNVNQSPFNVGLPLTLPPFSLAQTQELARRHGLDWSNSKEAKELRDFVGGHPYLIRIALYYLCQSGQSVTLKQLLAEAPSDSGIYGDRLRNLLLTLKENPQLYDAFGKVISSDRPVILEPIATYKLDRLGLVRCSTEGCVVSCELYRRYFNFYFGNSEEFGGDRFQ